VITAAIRRAVSPVTANVPAPEQQGKQKRPTPLVPLRRPKSVAMIRRDRDINFTIDNLTGRGNNRSAAELISFVQTHLANNL
jgi:hypothetical protein